LTFSVAIKTQSLIIKLPRIINMKQEPMQLPSL